MISSHNQMTKRSFINAQYQLLNAQDRVAAAAGTLQTNS